MATRFPNGKENKSDLVVTRSLKMTKWPLGFQVKKIIIIKRKKKEKKLDLMVARFPNE
jgi:hypothetical protein